MHRCSHCYALGARSYRICGILDIRAGQYVGERVRIGPVIGCGCYGRVEEQRGANAEERIWAWITCQLDCETQPVRTSWLHVLAKAKVTLTVCLSFGLNALFAQDLQFLRRHTV